MPDEKQQSPKADAPALPPDVEEVLAAWESAAVVTLGPMVSTEAFNAFTTLRANLRAQLVAALTR